MPSTCDIFLLFLTVFSLQPSAYSKYPKGISFRAPSYLNSYKSVMFWMLTTSLGSFLYFVKPVPSQDRDEASLMEEVYKSIKLGYSL